MTDQPYIHIPEEEIELTPTLSQGSGGQNVNKVATAIRLRFNIRTSSLSDQIKGQLFRMKSHLITPEGVIVIKAQSHRSQELNRRDALARLYDLIREASTPRKKRKPTRPTMGSKKRRLESKGRRGQTKQLRKKVTDD